MVDVPKEATDAADLRSAEIRDELLWRLRGMPKRLYEELFLQRRWRSRRYDDVPPSFVVDSAEGTTIFRGLNHSRHLIHPIRVALAEVSKDRAKAEHDYEERLRKARGLATEQAPASRVTPAGADPRSSSGDPEGQGGASTSTAFDI
jgi:hypothetical protein